MRYSVSRRRGRGRGLGWILLGVGVLLLAAPFIAGTLGALLWPLFVLAPALFLFAMVKQFGRGWAWLAVPATVIGATGLLLLVQNLVGMIFPSIWATWSFLGPLIMPGSFGLGLALYGDLARKEQVADLGEKIAKVGVAMSAGLFVLMSLIFGMSNFGWFLLPLALILAGVYFLKQRGRTDAPRRAKPTRPTALPSRQRSLSADEVDALERELFGEERRKERV